jgi:hypothetical protein
MNANLKKIPDTEQEQQDHDADIGFNHCLKPVNVIPIFQMQLPPRSGSIVVFQRLEDNNVRTWLLEIVVRRSNTITPFRGFSIRPE